MSLFILHLPSRQTQCDPFVHQDHRFCGQIPGRFHCKNLQINPARRGGKAKRRSAEAEG